MPAPDWSHIQGFQMIVAPIKLDRGTTSNGTPWHTVQMMDFQSGESFTASYDPTVWPHITLGVPGTYVFKIHFETVKAKVKDRWDQPDTIESNWKVRNVKTYRIRLEGMI